VQTQTKVKRWETEEERRWPRLERRKHS